MTFDDDDWLDLPVSDLGWRAEEMQRARAAGGVELEVYRRPGFLAGLGVRRSEVQGGGSGLLLDGTEEDDQ